MDFDEFDHYDYENNEQEVEEDWEDEDWEEEEEALTLEEEQRKAEEEAAVAKREAEEQNNYEQTKELFGSSGVSAGSVNDINTYQPQTAADFDAFADAIGERIKIYGRDPRAYISFLQKLMETALEPLSGEHTKIFSTKITTIVNTKLSAEKNKRKKKKKKKSKRKFVNTASADPFSGAGGESGTADFYDDVDFM
ncbi:hypothetical protein PCE1_002818 [Barthelona sp. PCE]